MQYGSTTKLVGKPRSALERRFGKELPFTVSLAIAALLLIALLVVWQLSVANLYSFSNPVRVANVLVSDMGTLLKATAETAQYVLISLLIGGMLAFVVGLGLAMYNRLAVVIAILIGVPLSFPKTSVYLIISYQYGLFDDTGIYVMLAYVTFIIVLFFVFRAARLLVHKQSPNIDQLFFSTMMFPTRWQIAQHYVAPLVLPTFLSSLSYVGFSSWPLMIFVEPLCFPAGNGIGNYVYDAYQSGDWDQFFAANVIIMVCGLTTVATLQLLRWLTTPKV